MLAPNVKIENAQDRSSKRERKISIKIIVREIGMEKAPGGNPEYNSSASAEKTAGKAEKENDAAIELPNTVKTTGLTNVPPKKRDKNRAQFNKNFFMELSKRGPIHKY